MMATPKKYRNFEKLGKAMGGTKCYECEGYVNYGSAVGFASLPVALVGDDCPVEKDSGSWMYCLPVGGLDYLPLTPIGLSFKGVSEYLPSPAMPEEAGWMNTVLFKDDYLAVSDNEICLRVTFATEEKHNVSFVVPRDAAKALKSATSEIVAMYVNDTHVTFEFLDQSKFTFAKVSSKWIDLDSWFEGWVGPDCESGPSQELPAFGRDLAKTILGFIDKSGAKFVTFQKDKIDVLDKEGNCFFSQPFVGWVEVNEPATFGVKSLKKVMKMIIEGDKDELEPHFDLRYAPYPSRFWFVDKQGRLVYGLLSCHGA